MIPTRTIRAIRHMYDVTNLSVTDIGRALGVSAPTVRKYVDDRTTRVSETKRARFLSDAASKITMAPGHNEAIAALIETMHEAKRLGY